MERTEQEWLELNKGDKFYPGHHMWTYCRFLGKFTNSEGRQYDLGIYVDIDNPDDSCEATVFGFDDSEYFSGSLNRKSIERMSDYPPRERYVECYNRAVNAGIIKGTPILLEQDEPDKTEDSDFNYYDSSWTN